MLSASNETKMAGDTERRDRFETCTVTHDINYRFKEVQ